MKRISLQTNLLIVRLCIIAAVLVLISLFLISFKTAGRLSGDMWKQLGITEQQASERIKNGFIYGYTDFAGTKNVRNMATGNKAAIAKDLMLYTKKFVNGPGLKSAYAKERAASKPQAISMVPVTKESVRKERIDELKKSIKESEEIVKKMPALEKDARKAIAGYEKAIKDYENPESKMLGIFYETAVRQQQHAKDQYEKRMMEWEASFPEDHRKKVKAFLENYLLQGATVDFDAELVERHNKKVFVKREFESKSSDWKMIYRAGKEVYNVVKPLAEQWLKEIQ